MSLCQKAPLWYNVSTMPMPIEKATNIIRSYKENNYNAKKTAKDNGYSETYADTRATKVVDSAYKAVAREIIASDSPRNTALAFTGLTIADIQKEYLFIIQQNKDLTNKLKALAPLLKEQGVVFDDTQTTLAPTVKLTMIQNGENMAQNGSNELMGGGKRVEVSVVSSDVPSLKTSQKDTFPQESIDNSSNTEIDKSFTMEEDGLLGDLSQSSEVTDINNEEIALSQGNSDEETRA